MAFDVERRHRSTWQGRRLNAPRELCELVPAHANSDRMEAACRRTDLVKRRQQLMQECGVSYCRLQTGSSRCRQRVSSSSRAFDPLTSLYS